MNRISRALRAFTLIELLTVMAIIMVLAGLVLMSAGFANQKAARSRAEVEISALSAACESYKADNGVYPMPRVQLSGSTDYGNPTILRQTSRALYQALSGDGSNALDGDGAVASDGKIDVGSTQYFEFKSKMLGYESANSPSTLYVQDPFGYSYGYYAPNVTGTTATSGSAQIYNPTFDLWSTGGTTTNSAENQKKWIKNWP